MWHDQNPKPKPVLYCPQCARPVNDPLTCGDCSAVICRVCGTPLESADELAFCSDQDASAFPPHRPTPLRRSFAPKESAGGTPMDPRRYRRDDGGIAGC